MPELSPITRREFLNRSLATAGTVGVAAATAAKTQAAAAAASNSLPVATLGKAKISRVLLGGNLISGGMHARDLKYVSDLFRAYATEQKMMETLKLAEECGINTVFETGAKFVQRYNREFKGHMQFIPHIQVKADQSDDDLRVHIEKQVESGACALYVWGVAADKLVQTGEVKRIAKAVELAKLHDLPVGVGGHSLLVPMACEKHGIPCDFYVKTFHRDNYPSATPKELRKEFIWLDGGKGWYDNMWCINPEETAEFMKTVSKPWIAFKVLAAGAIQPKDGFTYAFRNGADLIAVGMLDFQIRENCELARKVIRETQTRQRRWRA